MGEMERTRCGHVFHKVCMDGYKASGGWKNECPTCKANYTTGEAAASLPEQVPRDFTGGALPHGFSLATLQAVMRQTTADIREYPNETLDMTMARQARARA